MNSGGAALERSRRDPGFKAFNLKGRRVSAEDAELGLALLTQRCLGVLCGYAFLLIRSGSLYRRGTYGPNGAKVLRRGGALHFYTRPFFEQGEGGGVIQVLLAFFGGEIIDFFNGLESRQFHPRFFRGLEGEADVFMH